jgi:hypothetical protein
MGSAGTAMADAGCSERSARSAEAGAPSIEGCARRAMAGDTGTEGPEGSAAVAADYAIAVRATGWPVTARRWPLRPAPWTVGVPDPTRRSGRPRRDASLYRLTGHNSLLFQAAPNCPRFGIGSVK